jgi:formate dehydrogenase (coenzyme F420) beta subunit
LPKYWKDNYRSDILSVVHSGGISMSSRWSLDTHGEPLGKLREFIRTIWFELDLDGLLVTLDGGIEPRPMPQLITDPADIDSINPFKPLMEINAATLIPELIMTHPGKNLAALLRPCEMRALIEMTRLASIKIDDLLTMSVDCLGTLPADEYQWRLERIRKNEPADGSTSENSKDQLTNEALKFAHQGGIGPYRYRSACQVCPSPIADSAKINIQILGLPVRQKMMVVINDLELERIFHPEILFNGEAAGVLVLQHERVVSKLRERHQRTMQRINQGLGEMLPEDVDAFINQLDSCGNCQSCMQVCPICSVDRPGRASNGHYNRSDVIRWLVSCAGCGMCEQSCPTHLPLYAIFAHIRHQLDQEWQYIPGQSMEELSQTI